MDFKLGLHWRLLKIMLVKLGFIAFVAVMVLVLVFAISAGFCWLYEKRQGNSSA